MSLSKANLKRELKSYFDEVAELNESYSHKKTATDIFNIYKGYAMKATDPSGDTPLIVDLSSVSVLIGRFSSQSAGEGIRQTLVLFWTGAMFKTVVPHSTMSQEATSVVVGMDPSLLTNLFVDNYENSDKAAEYLADKLHKFTKSIAVLITGLAKAGSPPPTITATGKLS